MTTLFGGASDSALILEDVTKHAHGKRVLSGLSLHVAVGELVIVRAPKGAEKTTLARLIAGQTLPDQGRIWRVGPCAPPPGVTWGFTQGAPVVRGLDLRAAVYDVDTRDYV